LAYADFYCLRALRVSEALSMNRRKFVGEPTQPRSSA
jgi:hypothetical protein